MPNSVFLSRQAEKFLSNLRDAALYGRLRNAIDILTENARPPGCVKLAGGALALAALGYWQRKRFGKKLSAL